MTITQLDATTGTNWGPVMAGTVLAIQSEYDDDEVSAEITGERHNEHGKQRDRPAAASPASALDG